MAGTSPPLNFFNPFPILKEIHIRYYRPIKYSVISLGFGLGPHTYHVQE